MESINTRIIELSIKKRMKRMNLTALLLSGVCLLCHPSDEFGITYIIFTIEEIMNLMNLGNKKVNKMLKELEEHGLIYRRHQDLGRPNKIYVHDILQPETSEWTPEIQLKKWRNKK